jgi:glyceraldehyde-3-phosphate dehydrogenase/erythrose-4-phosphate dehydrogenase
MKNNQLDASLSRLDVSLIMLSLLLLTTCFLPGINVLPALKGKLIEVAVHLPTLDVSFID